MFVFVLEILLLRPTCFGSYFVVTDVVYMKNSRMHFVLNYGLS